MMEKELDRVLSPIHDNNLVDFERKFNKVLTALWIEFVAIISGTFSLEETTQSIDRALNCINDWNIYTVFSNTLTKYSRTIQRTKVEEWAVEHYVDNMLYMRHKYELLKEDGRYYDSSYSVPLPQKEPKPIPKEYFRMDSKQGRHGPYYYCLEYYEYHTFDEVADRIWKNPDVTADMFRYKAVFYRDEHHNYRLKTCVWISLKFSTSLKEVKEAFPGAKVYHGKKAFEFREKYLVLDYGIDFFPVLGWNQYEDEVEQGSDSFYKEYSSNLIW